MLTRYEFDQWATNPLLRKAFFPDGTLEQIEATENGTQKTIVIYRGAKNPGPGYPIRIGQRTTTVINQVGQTLSAETVEIRNNIPYPDELQLSTQLDELARPTEIKVYHSGATNPTYTATQTFGCCGLVTQTGQDRLTASFYYDDLTRLRKVHRNGLSFETVFDGRTTRSHLYPEAVPSPLTLANATNQTSSTTHNLGGDIVATTNRSPKDGSLVTINYATSYDLGGGIGRRVITTLPLTPDDQGVAPTITEDHHLDGRPAQSTGTPIADTRFTYGHNAFGPTTTIALLEGINQRLAITTQLDWMGRALKTTYADGEEEAYTYDLAGRLASTTDPDGVTVLHSYDLLAETTHTALDLNKNGILDLDLDEVRTTRKGVSVDGEGKTILWTERSIRDTINGTPLDVLLSRTESTVDLLKSSSHTYSNGTASTAQVSTNFLPDQSGAWDKITTLADGTSLTQQFRGGLLDQETARDSNNKTLLTRGFLYDQHLRITDLTDSSGPTIKQSYVGDLINYTQTQSIGTRTTSYQYDARGRLVVIDEPDTTDHTGTNIDNRQQLSYWPHDALREVNGTPGYRRSFTYDYAHRLASLTTYGSAQAVTRWQYDPLRGWLEKKLLNSPTPGSGTGDLFTYTPGGRPKTRLSPRGITSTHARGSDGRITGTTYTDGTPATVINKRDRRGRPTSITDAAGTRLLAYNDYDQLTSTSWQAGSLLEGWTVNQGRDLLGRLSALDLTHNATTAHNIGYAYDPAGRLAAVESHNLKAHHIYSPTTQLLAQLSVVDDERPLHFATRQYDGLNRLERITYHNGQTRGAFQSHSDFHYLRDSYGRTTTATLRDGTQWRYGYNARGELASAKRHLSKSSPALLAGQSFAWNYDGVGNRLSSQRGGDSSGANLRTTTYTPNPLNQSSAIQAPGYLDITGTAPATPDVFVNGNLASRQGDFFRFEVQSNNVGGPVAQPVTVSQGADTESGNVLIPPATSSPTYDPDGNQLSDSTYQYSWDAEDRLTALETTPAAVASGVPYTRVAYTYDSASRLVQRQEYEHPAPAPPVAITRYLHAGWRCLGELDHTDSLQKSYAWGLDNTDSLHLGDSNAALLWLHDHNTNETHLTTYDGNGNITGLISAQTSEPSATYSYSPYGQLLTSTGPYADSNNYRYSTKPQDPATGHYNYGYRHYNPTTGSWLTRDPIAENGGLNLYGFVGNNPIGSHDVLGQFLKTTDHPRYALTMAAFYGAAEFATLDAVSQIMENLSAQKYFEDAGCPELYAELINENYDWGSTGKQAAIGAAVGLVFGKFAGPLLKRAGSFLGSRFPSLGEFGRRLAQSGDTPFWEALKKPSKPATARPRGSSPAPAPAPPTTPRASRPAAPPPGSATAAAEGNFFLLNRTHSGSLPRPKGTGPSGGRLQSHHGLQQEWSIHNLSRFGYKPDRAPTITLETGRGFPHTGLSAAQNARRNARVSAGQGKWSSSLQDELQFILDDLTAAGFQRSTIEQVLNQQYQMLEKLGVSFQKIDF